MPFRDAWDVKGPVTYLPFTLVSATVGPLPWAYRLVDLLALGGGALALGGVVRKLGMPGLAPAAGLALVLTQASFGWWGTLQPDQWAAWLITGAVACVLDDRPGPRRFAASGALVGLATLIKPHYAIFLAIPLLAGRGIESGSRRTLVVSLTGAALPVLACGAWFLASGALPDLIDGYVLFNLDAWRLGEFQVGSTEQGLRRVAARLPFLPALLPMALLGLAAAWRAERRRGAILGTWVAAALLGVVLQGRWFIYQWAPVVPAVLAGGAAAIASWHAETPRRFTAIRRAGIVASGLIAATFVGRDLLTAGRGLAGYTSSSVPRTEHLRLRAPVRDYSPAEIAQTAAMVRRATVPADCVLVWSDPVVNVLTERRTPSRFATFVPLTMGAPTPRRARYRAEFMATLSQRPPRLVLIDSFTLSTRLGVRGGLTTRFPEFLELVRSQFDSTGTTGKYAVWSAPGHSSSPCR